MKKIAKLIMVSVLLLFIALLVIKITQNTFKNYYENKNYNIINKI